MVRPVGSVTNVATGPVRREPAGGPNFVLHGESGLVIQSYGAIALISSAALAAQAAHQQAPPLPAIAPVEPVDRVAAVRRVDTWA